MDAQQIGNQVLLVAAAMLLVLLNGFFVAAEFSLVKLRETRVSALERRHGWRGRMLARVHGELDAYLSACQLGITLASLGLGWIGEPAFARLLAPVFEAFGIASQRVIHTAAFATAFFLISSLHIVVGELAPKSMAIRLTEKIGLWTAAPLCVFYWTMYPLIWMLNQSSNWLLRRMRLDLAQVRDNHYSAEELKLILRSTMPDADFTVDEWRVLAQALDFRNLDVEDLMRPFSEVKVLFAQESFHQSLERIAQHRFSRYPLLDKKGTVKGLVHVKDILYEMHLGKTDIHLETLARPVLTVRPDASAMELFRAFRQGMPHFAVVGFKNHRPVGFITLDNLLGALVGEIRDEFRKSDHDWVKLDDGSLLGKGSLPIFTLERALGTDIPVEESPDSPGSVGGLIIQKLEDLPEEGQRIHFEQFDVVVKKMNGPRILLVRVWPVTPKE